MSIFLIKSKSYYLALDYILKDRNFPEVDSKYFTTESCLQEYCCPYIYYMFSLYKLGYSTLKTTGCVTFCLSFAVGTPQPTGENVTFLKIFRVRPRSKLSTW